MLKTEYFDAIAKSVLSTSSSNDEVLSLMIVLHTHEFFVSDSVTLDDAGEDRVLAALTRWGAAYAVASVFEREHDSRKDKSYWHAQYCKKTPFEGMAGMPAQWRERVDSMIARVSKLTIVSSLREEL